jgi:phosphatidylserine decarboxylase
MSFVKEGDRVASGERVGLIRFGSRVDVYLPEGTGSQVLLGQRTIAGETVIGELGIDPKRSGTSQ